MRWLFAFVIVIAAVAGVMAHDVLLSAGRFASPGTDEARPEIDAGEAVAPVDPRLIAAEQCDLDQVREISRMPAEFWTRMDAETANGVEGSAILASAEAGDAESMVLLAFYFAGRTEDEAQARLWLRRAADAGIPAAQNEVGYAHAHALYGFEKSPDLAREWLELALSSGDAIAAHSLGELYMAGLLDLPADSERNAGELAMDYYLTAASQCYCGSLEMVSEELRIGRYLDRDTASAIEMLRLVRQYQAGTDSPS